MSCRASCLVAMLAGLPACPPACLPVRLASLPIDRPASLHRTHTRTHARLGCHTRPCVVCVFRLRTLRQQQATRDLQQTPGWRRWGVASSAWKSRRTRHAFAALRWTTLRSLGPAQLSRQQRFAHFRSSSLHFATRRWPAGFSCWHTNLARMPGGAPACSVALLPRPWCRRQGPPPKSLLLSGVYPPNLGDILGGAAFGSPLPVIPCHFGLPYPVARPAADANIPRTSVAAELESQSVLDVCPQLVLHTLPNCPQALPLGPP